MTMTGQPYQNNWDDGEGDSYDPQSGTTKNFLASWYVRGYTASLGSNGAFNYTPLIPSTPATSDFATLPSELALLTEIHQVYFSPDHDPLGGFLTFLPSDDFTFTVNSVSYRVPRRLSGTETWPSLDSGVSPWAFSMEGSGSIYIWRGMLIVKLFPTDTAGIVTDSGQPLTYHVIEHFLGGREFDITVPDSADVQDLTSLIIPGSIKPYRYDPVCPLGMVDEDDSPEPPNELPVKVQSSLDTDTVSCVIDLTANGVSSNPTSLPIFFAFMQGGKAPADADWNEGSWLFGGPPYTAGLLIGPDNDALLLVPGQYQIWSKLVDFPQVIVELIGTLYIK